MASSTSASSLWFFFTCSWIFVLTSGDQQQIIVKTGEDVTLQCQSPRSADVELLEWRRPELEKDVFVWKNGNPSEDDQHPSLHGRVELKNPEMKDGNFSVILKNVTINDTGTYECYVKYKNIITPQYISIITLTVDGSDQQQITVKTGEDVILQCQSPRGADVGLLEWRRPDLEKEVFVWNDGKEQSNDQHESFHGRVELKDPEMKDGDVSVILKNVTINDTGTYECYVKNITNTTTPPPLITNITLAVKPGHRQHEVNEDGGDKHGVYGPIVSVSLIIVLLVVAVYLILKKCKWQNSEIPPPDESVDQQLT